MTGADLWAEFSAAQRDLTPPDRVMLEDHGIAPGHILFLIGISQIRVDRGLYEPDSNGGEAFVSPVLVEDPFTPETVSPETAVHFGELVDLVAWHPRRPSSFALRTGAAEWLGAIEPQYFEPSPVPIHRSVLRWFQSGCRGLVLLTQERGARHLLLTGCRGGVVAEDDQHAAELQAIMRPPWRAPPVTVARAARMRHAA